MPTPSTIPHRLKDLRKALNLTQAEFAEKINIEQGNLSAMENGKRQPAPYHIELIMNRFSVNPEWWKTGSGPIFAAAPNQLPVVEWTSLQGAALSYITLPYLSDADKFVQYPGPDSGLIHAGALLALRTTAVQRLVTGKYVVVDHQEGPFIGAFVEADEAYIRLRVDFSANSIVVLERRMVKVLYRVVGVVERM